MPKKAPDPVHKYRRHAQLYGTSKVYETACQDGFTPARRAGLAAYLAKLEPRERRASPWQLTRDQRERLLTDLAMAGITSPPISPGISKVAVAKMKATIDIETKAQALLDKHGPVDLLDSGLPTVVLSKFRTTLAIFPTIGKRGVHCPTGKRHYTLNKLKWATRSNA